jgi:hypothetical protein
VGRADHRDARADRGPRRAQRSAHQRDLTLTGRLRILPFADPDTAVIANAEIPAS